MFITWIQFPVNYSHFANGFVIDDKVGHFKLL